MINLPEAESRQKETINLLSSALLSSLKTALLIQGLVINLPEAESRQKETINLLSSDSADCSPPIRPKDCSHDPRPGDQPALGKEQAERDN